MFEKINLDYYYSVQAPTGGGATDMKMKTNYDSSIPVKNYFVVEDLKNGHVEYFSLYSTGLALFFKQTSSLIEMYSNKEFELQDDGTFVLISW